MYRIIYKPIPHGWGVYPQAAAGFPYTAASMAVKGDPVADLTEDLAAEQKARATYEKLIDLCKDDAAVVDVLRYLREREVVHFQRFGEALNGVQEKLRQKNYYFNNGRNNNNLNNINTNNNFNNMSYNNNNFNNNNNNSRCNCNNR